MWKYIQRLVLQKKKVMGKPKTLNNLTHVTVFLFERVRWYSKPTFTILKQNKNVSNTANLLRRKVKLLLIPNYYHYASTSGEMIESGVANARALIIVKTELRYRKMWLNPLSFFMIFGTFCFKISDFVDVPLKKGCEKGWLKLERRSIKIHLFLKKSILFFLTRAV